MKLEVTILGGVLQFQEMPEGFNDGKYEIDIRNMDYRSNLQNSAIHLYCDMVAKQLNSQNLSIVNVIKPDTPWTMMQVKEMLWKPVLKALRHKDSTTKMDKQEITIVYDTINKILGERFGIHIPFPSIDTKEKGE